MALRLRKFGFVAAVFGAMGLTAQAGLLPLTATVNPEGDNYRYTYGVMLTSNSTLTAGDSFVIYDFAGFVPGSAQHPGDFSFSTVNTGGNPGRTVPNDNPDIPNLIWTYTGETALVGQIGLGDFSALSNRPESSVNTDFSSRTKVEDPNGIIRIEDNITSTKAPAGTEPTGGGGEDPPPGVPEPSTILLIAAGLPLAAGMKYFRGRKKAVVA